MKKIVGIGLICILLLSISVFAAPLWKGDTTSSALQGANFAVYAGPGTWQDSITAFENILAWKGLTWEEVGYRDINNNDLRLLYDGIFFPGGFAGDYKKKINNNGVQNIRDLINDGGIYMGTSAGAFFACDRITWNGQNTPFHLDLFMGDCIGPIDEIAPWPSFVITTMNMELSHPANVYEPAQRDIYYQGEPYFVADPGQEMMVMARWIVPSNPSVDNTPGIISFNYGQGRVVLIGPHPEIEEDSDRDGATAGDNLFDGHPDHSDWPFFWTAIDWAYKNPISQAPNDDPSLDTIVPTISNVQDNGPANVGDGVTISADITDQSDGIDSPVIARAWVTIEGIEHDMTQQSGGGSTLFFDDFEAGDLNNWVISGLGDPWTASQQEPFAGSWHAQSRHSGANDPTYMETSVSTSGGTGITVSYHRRLVGLDKPDDFAAEWFDGSAWNVLEHLGNAQGRDNNYVFKSFGLPSGADDNANFKLRFMCEGSGASEYCRVDDVTIEAGGGTGVSWEYVHGTTGMSSGLHPYTVNAVDGEGNQAITVAGDFTLN